jgi:hypothetical protein
VDRGGFWYMVLVTRYGEEVRRLEVGGPECFILVEGDSED